jgi:hypothetical protein
MTIQSYEIRALDDFGGRIHWIPSDLGAWCPADSVRRLEADMKALRAELDASIAAREEMQLGGNRMGESLRSAREELADLKAELAELKAPPKVLRAEEVTEVGYYWHKSGKEWEIVEYYPCSGFEFPDFGQFIGPIQMSEV